MTAVFFIEPTERSRRWLRRYASGQDCAGCTYHNGMTALDEVPFADAPCEDAWPHDDPRWPKTCDACGYVFQDGDDWQVFTRRIYRAADGREMTLQDAPVGACWDATWFDRHRNWTGPDGRSLTVKLPGNHDWMIDSRASNCTLPDDDEHKCWVRHGRPEDGTLHVDKNGLTCSAGAGSIAVTGYHGFLHNGHLTDC